MAQPDPPAATVAAAAPEPPLAHLMPGWFATVMGWCGLALAWHRAQVLLGEPAGRVAEAAGTFALALFVMLLVPSVVRARRHPHALRADLAHPVRRGFVAALPISLLLLVTLAVASGVQGAVTATLWWLAALVQFGVTVWILSRWLQAPAGGAAWQGVTPVLFIPVVGNVIVPLAGLPLGFGAWALAQFAVGLLFWVVVGTMLAVRLVQVGPLPERLLPAWFITVAPPSVIGLVALLSGAPAAFAWMAWGVALFFLAWSATVLGRIRTLPFAVPHWATSFPTAAFTALTLRLSAQPDGGWLQVPALVLLAATTLLLLLLTVATARGLARGTLLVPETAPGAAPGAAR
jgi:tellurite resistance protein